MFRPTGFADLTGRRVGIWGYGIEGRALARLLQDRSDVVIVDDQPVDDAVVATQSGGLALLAGCDVVLKTPGIPRYREDVVALAQSGASITSGLNLWLRDADRSRVIAVTGTKGKSTTTSIITFLLRCAGLDAESAGNIGRPPYDLAERGPASWTVVEVSSFQAVDVEVAPLHVVVTSLGSDHLDWHGSLAQYHDDKLSLTRAEGPHVTWCADDDVLRAESALLGGEVRFVSGEEVELARALGLLGAHNARNVRLALAVASAASGLDEDELRRLATERHADFEPLPGRLSVVETRVGASGTIRFVDDGLATAPLPTQAALEAFDGPVALITGGFDRGVDYEGLAAAIAARRDVVSVVAMGPAGDRLAELLASRGVAATRTTTMDEAVAVALRSLEGPGVVLFSPGAPSFDQYRNWEERAADFRRAVSELD